MSRGYTWEELPEPIAEFLRSGPEPLRGVIGSEDQYDYVPPEIINGSNLYEWTFKQRVPGWIEFVNFECISKSRGVQNKIGRGLGFYHCDREYQIPSHAYVRLRVNDDEKYTNRLSRSIFPLPGFGFYIAGERAFEDFKDTEVGSHDYHFRIPVKSSSGDHLSCAFLIDPPIYSEIIDVENSKTRWYMYKDKWYFEISVFNADVSTLPELNISIARDVNKPDHVFVSIDLANRMKKSKTLNAGAFGI